MPPLWTFVAVTCCCPTSSSALYSVSVADESCHHAAMMGQEHYKLPNDHNKKNLNNINDKRTYKLHPRHSWTDQAQSFVKTREYCTTDLCWWPCTWTATKHTNDQPMTAHITTLHSITQYCTNMNNNAKKELILQLQHNPESHGTRFNQKPTTTVHLVTLYYFLYSAETEEHWDSFWITHSITCNIRGIRTG